MKQGLTTSDDNATALLRLASYLGRPPKLMPVADARAEMRRTLELVAKRSVVLTTAGEPEAAIVPVTTLEDMRQALLHLLVEKMGASFERSKGRAQSQQGDVPATSEVELEALVGAAVKKARRRNANRREKPRAGKHGC
jgi:hypothetical protein